MRTILDVANEQVIRNVLEQAERLGLTELADRCKVELERLQENQTNDSDTKSYSPSERDLQLSRLATAYANSNDARARNMIRGKAQKLVNQTYKVEANRDAVWQEWLKLAGVKWAL